MGQLVLLDPQGDEGRDIEEWGLIEFGDVCVEDLQAHGIPGQRGGHYHNARPRALHLGGPGAGTLARAAIIGQPGTPDLAAHQQKEIVFQWHGLCKGREHMSQSHITNTAVGFKPMSIFVIKN